MLAILHKVTYICKRKNKELHKILTHELCALMSTVSFPLF